MTSNNHYRINLLSILRRQALALPLLFVMLFSIEPTQAQNQFSSGSTGADGPFKADETPAVQEIQLPESGVFNYTTYLIPAGVTIRYKPNSKNTPVKILATGDVTILGRIDISGGNGSPAVFGAASPNGGGLGGPGGFNGGHGGFSFDPFFSGAAGDGPGGGGGGNSIGGGSTICGGGGGFAILVGRSGMMYGSRSLTPLIGGSGGGGGGGENGRVGIGGGGGGGAILIASSTMIRFGSGQTQGEILATGGNSINSNASSRSGGSGSGGAIRLVANAISGKANFNVDSGFANCSGFASHGYIRIEAFSYNGFEPQASPQTTQETPSQPIISLAQPTIVNLPNEPQLTIASVGGVNAPTVLKGSFGATPDILLPATLANPVTVALQAANIPVGTVVKISVLPESAARTTVDSSPLAGTQAALTATASVNLPATGTSVITATASFDLPKIAQAKPLLVNGESVRRVEVAASFGGKAAVTYITESGKRIRRETE